MDFLSARTSKPILIASLFSMSLFTKADVLFTESFDDQPDFTSTMHDSTRGGREIWNGAILPEGWDAMFQGTQWSPETGYPDNHASFEILASNADKARGGTGKSMVNWRESYNAGWNNWASDSQLIKYLDKQHDEIYIEFWISFGWRGIWQALKWSHVLGHAWNQAGTPSTGPSLGYCLSPSQNHSPC